MNEIERIYKFDNLKFAIETLNDVLSEADMKQVDIEILEVSIDDCAVYESEDEYKDPVIRRHKKFSKYIQKKKKMYKEFVGDHTEDEFDPFEFEMKKETSQYIIRIRTDDENIVGKMDDLVWIAGGTLTTIKMKDFYSKARRVIALTNNLSKLETLLKASNISENNVGVFRESFGN
jgi:hypothetical protein